MARITYEQAFLDHEYLWDTYGAAYDMTGGYVDQEDLEKLLRNPTKATARKCLESQIVYWFQVGPDINSSWSDSKKALQDALDNDPYLTEIAERYGIF